MTELRRPNRSRGRNNESLARFDMFAEQILLAHSDEIEGASALVFSVPTISPFSQLLLGVSLVQHDWRSHTWLELEDL